jgi:hypothetical protein
MCTDTRLQTDAPGVEQQPNGGGSARRRSTKGAHHAARTPSCERRSTVGNGLPSGGLAARQGLGRHGGKQGKRNNAAEVPNAGEVSRVRARGRVCVSEWARSFGQDGVRMNKGVHQLGMVLARPGRKVALGGGDRVRRDQVGRRRRVLGCLCRCARPLARVCAGTG